MYIMHTCRCAVYTCVHVCRVCTYVHYTCLYNVDMYLLYTSTQYAQYVNVYTRYTYGCMPTLVTGEISNILNIVSQNEVIVCTFIVVL